MTDEPPDAARELSEHVRRVRDAVDSMRATKRVIVTEEPGSRELSKEMRESYRLLTEEGIECGLDLDGLLTVCDLTMDDLQVVGQQVSFPPAHLDSFGPVWLFVEVERWLGPPY